MDEQLAALEQRASAVETEMDKLRADVTGLQQNKRARYSVEGEAVVTENEKLKYQLEILHRALEKEQRVDLSIKDDGKHSVNILRAVSNIVLVAIRHTFPSIPCSDAGVTPCTVKGKLADPPTYQSNVGLKLLHVIKSEPSGASFKRPHDVANAIIKNLPANEIIGKCEVAGPGFINIYLNKQFLNSEITKLAQRGVLPPAAERQRVIVDLSSPNIAKEMHVGHLRSTIIGDAIARTLEFMNHDVLRINHVGDWGTQFGMLIAHLKDKFPNYLSESPPIHDLMSFYRESKTRFDKEPEFKKRAYLEVVKLQKGEPDVTAAWNLICDVSRKEFSQIYQRLDIRLEEKGESFYQKFMEEVVEELTKSNKLSEDWSSPQFGWLLAAHRQQFPDGTSAPVDLTALFEQAKSKADDQAFNKFAAKCFEQYNENKEVPILKAWASIVAAAKKGFPAVIKALPAGHNDRVALNAVVKQLETDYAAKHKTEPVKPRLVMFTEKEDAPPLIVVKSDGGYTYDTSDLATIRYRIQQEKANWIIYVVDAGQSTHFDIVFAGARAAGWYNEATTRVNHVAFGLVLGEDKKKFRTRSGDTVNLRTLLDEGIERSQAAAKKRAESASDKESVVDDMAVHEAVAYGCIKYADLSHNRLSDYVFSFDKMLSTSGNTAVYLLYALTRIRSILRQPALDSIDLEALKASASMQLTLDCELRLAAQLLRFSEVVERVLEDLMPNYICDYLYELSNVFTDFYHGCKVITQEPGQDPVVDTSRVLLCDATRLVMEQCFSLLGIRTVDRM